MNNRRTKIIVVSLAAVGIAFLVWGAIYLHRMQDRNHAEEAKREHDLALQYVALPSISVEPLTDATEIAFAGAQDVSLTPAPTDAPLPTITVMGEPEVSPEPTPSEGQTASGNPKKSGKEKSGLEALYDLNPDIAGWIRIAGTEIDYPFVAIGDKANKYLETSFDGKTKSKFGTIFTRNNVSDPLSIPNFVLYGHNMAATGYGMFTQLLKYKSADFAKNHNTVEIIVGNTTMTYEFFCCYNIKTTDAFLYEQMSFVGPKDLTRYSEEILKRSKVKADSAVAGAAHYVTLSTCDRKYDNDHGRFVVVFVRK